MGSIRIIAFGAAACIACGGGSFVPRGDGGTNHPPDFAGTVVDLSGGFAFPDFSTENPDFSGTQQLPDFAVAPDMTVAPPGDCLSPADCPFNDPICCADVTIGNGQIPLCPITSVQPACAATCATNLPLMCPANAVAALCQQAADCTDVNYPNCCTMNNGGIPITACVDAIYKMFVATQCF